MHQTRQATTTKIPIPRKGTKYVVRAISHVDDSVPILIAIRDMLKLARTTREVKAMIKDKMLKLNGRLVRDFRESIKLFNVLEADRDYRLSILPTGRFVFEESKDKNSRLCRVINRRLVGKDTFQINLHDGTNLVTKDKINVHDSLKIDFEGKIIQHIKFEKGKNVFIFAGKYQGNEGKVDSVEKGKVMINIKDREELVQSPISQVIVI